MLLVLMVLVVLVEVVVVEVVVVMVVVVSVPLVIHVLVTNSHVTLGKLVGLGVGHAQLHRVVLAELGAMRGYGQLVLGKASVHLDQVEHGHDVRRRHQFLGLRVLGRAAHLVLEEGGGEGRVQAGGVEEQAAELGQVHQVEAGTQGLAQVLVGHGVVLCVQLLQDPGEERGIFREGIHGSLQAAGLKKPEESCSQSGLGTWTQSPQNSEDFF